MGISLYAEEGGGELVGRKGEEGCRKSRSGELDKKLTD